MDFKSIMSLFREDDWTGELMEKLDEMLALGGRMFSYTMNVVIEGANGSDPQVELFGRDKRINELMRKIRRRVTTRLSLGGSKGEVPTALIFMNAVKDAERVGDYVKNLYEIADLQDDEPDRQLYRDWLGERAERIAALIEATREAFAEGDDEASARVIADCRQLGKECEATIREITDTVTSVRDAVCLVLALRFYKRIVAHLSNIATTVVMPIDLLDFHDEPGN
jgi:phosphate transport system protein